MIDVQRLSNEVLEPIIYNRAGVIVKPADVDSIEFCIVPYDHEAITEDSDIGWETAVTTEDGNAGLPVGPGSNHDWTDLTEFPAWYNLYARINAGGRHPVVPAGSFSVRDM